MIGAFVRQASGKLAVVVGGADDDCRCFAVRASRKEKEKNALA